MNPNTVNHINKMNKKSNILTFFEFIFYYWTAAGKIADGKSIDIQAADTFYLACDL